MKNRKKILLIIPIVVLLYSFTGPVPDIIIFNHNKVIHYNFGDDYEAAWRKVDSLVQKMKTTSLKL
jgi:hypothetical protein